jgi:hypothetical protein
VLDEARDLGFEIVRKPRRGTARNYSRAGAPGQWNIRPSRARKGSVPPSNSEPRLCRMVNETVRQAASCRLRRWPMDTF